MTRFGDDALDGALGDADQAEQQSLDLREHVPGPAEECAQTPSPSQIGGPRRYINRAPPRGSRSSSALARTVSGIVDQANQAVPEGTWSPVLATNELVPINP